MTKQQIRDYIKFENAFGKSPFAGLEKETQTKLYRRYRKIFGYRTHF
jgi:hypothetical protein